MRSIAALADGYSANGEHAHAVPLCEERLALLSRKLPHNHPDRVGALVLLAFELSAARKSNEAAPLWDEYFALHEAAWSGDERRLSDLMATAGSMLLKVDAFPEAEKWLRKCLAIRERSAPDDWFTFYTRTQVGAALVGQAKLHTADREAATEKLAAAEPLLISGIEGLEARRELIPVKQRVGLIEAVEWLIKLHELREKPEEAERWRAKLTENKGIAPPQETTPTKP
jgi:hypothetical protein